MKTSATLLISLLALLAQEPASAASNQATSSPNSKAKIYTHDDWWSRPFNKPLTVAGYKFVPGHDPSYHVRSYKITKGGKVLASDKCGQDGWDRQFGIVLPYATNKPITRADLRSGKIESEGPAYWSETVFGIMMWSQEQKTPAPARLAPGTDVTGDGVPDLVIGYQPEGHYGYKATVYSLGPKLKKVLTIEGEDNPVYIKDVDGDGLFEVLAADSTFNDFYSSYSMSGKPRVIQRIKNNRLTVATDLMKGPKISSSYLQKATADGKKIYADGPKDENAAAEFIPFVTREMLNMVYTGNANAAWNFLDQVWPLAADRKMKMPMQVDPTERTKAQFLQEFKERLRKSPYWAGLQELNPKELASTKSRKNVLVKGCP